MLKTQQDTLQTVEDTTKCSTNCGKHKKILYNMFKKQQKNLQRAENTKGETTVC